APRTPRAVARTSSHGSPHLVGKFEPTRGPAQYESPGIASPPAIAPRAFRMAASIESFTGRTEPSPSRRQTTPGCRPLAVMATPFHVSPLAHDLWPGGNTWL